MKKLFDIFNSFRQPTSKIFNILFKYTKLQIDHLINMQNFLINLVVIKKKLVMWMLPNVCNSLKVG